MEKNLFIESIETEHVCHQLIELRGSFLMPSCKIRESNPFGIIVISAYCDEAAKHRMMREGVFDYLAKPFELEELEAVIEDYLTRQKILHRRRKGLTVDPRQGGVYNCWRNFEGKLHRIYVKDKSQ